MNQGSDGHLTALFDSAETELPGDDFGTQVMMRVKRYNIKTALLQYASRLLMLSCLCSIFPAVVKMALYIGNMMGNLPSQFTDFLLSCLGSPITLIILISSTGCLLFKFRYFLKLPEINLFGKIKPF